MLIKTLLCLFVLAALASAQPFGIGIKAGVPATSAYSILQNSQTVTETHYYTFGGYAELRLPASLAIEIDALYRTYQVQSANTHSWEFPVVVKHHFLPGPIKPYFEVGASFSRLSDIKVSSLQHLSDYGIVAGAGVELKLIALRISPEVRYTGWWFHNFDGTQVQSNRNQVAVLVGIGF